VTKTYNDALEWAAQWIEDTLRNGPETNERTIEFGRNMAMTFRAAKLSGADLPRATAEADDKELIEAVAQPWICVEDKPCEEAVPVHWDEMVTALAANALRATESTIESVLQELRELFPSTDIQVINTAWTWHKPSGIFMDDHRFRILINHKTFEGQSANDCMNQVRAWSKSRAATSEGEKSK